MVTSTWATLSRTNTPSQTQGVFRTFASLDAGQCIPESETVGRNKEWTTSLSTISCPDLTSGTCCQRDGTNLNGKPPSLARELSTCSSLKKENTTSAGHEIFHNGSNSTGKAEVPNGRRNTSPSKSCSSKSERSSSKHASPIDAVSIGGLTMFEADPGEVNEDNSSFRFLETTPLLVLSCLDGAAVVLQSCGRSVWLSQYPRSANHGTIWLSQGSPSVLLGLSRSPAWDLLGHSWPQSDYSKGPASPASVLWLLRLAVAQSSPG